MLQDTPELDTELIPHRLRRPAHQSPTLGGVALARLGVRPGGSRETEWSPIRQLATWRPRYEAPEQAEAENGSQQTPRDDRGKEKHG